MLWNLFALGERYLLRHARDFGQCDIRKERVWLLQAIPGLRSRLAPRGIHSLNRFHHQRRNLAARIALGHQRQQRHDIFLAKQFVNRAAAQDVNLLLFNDVPRRRQSELQRKHSGDAIEKAVERTDLQAMQVSQQLLQHRLGTILLKGNAKLFL